MFSSNASLLTSDTNNKRDIYITNNTYYPENFISNQPSGIKIQDAVSKVEVTNELLGDDQELQIYKEFAGVKRIVVGSEFDLGSAAADWSTVVIEADEILSKAVVHFTGSTGKVVDHDLYVIQGGSTELLSCPDAANLVEVEVGCSNGVTFDIFPSTKTVDGVSVTVSIVTEDGFDYYKAAGVTGTGGAGINGCGQIAGALAGDTQACQQITGGGLSISAPSSVTFPSADISSVDTHSTAVFSAPVIIQDLRDTNVGFTGSVTMSDFISGTDKIPYTNLQLKTNALTSAATSLLSGVTAPNQVLSSFTGVGSTSDAMTIMMGSAIQRTPGQWQVTPELDLLINAYQPSGSYTSTMIFTAV